MRALWRVCVYLWRRLDYLEDEWTEKLAEHMSRNAQLRVDVKQAERRAKEAERRAEKAEAALAAANARIVELEASLEAHVLAPDKRENQSEKYSEGQTQNGRSAKKRRRHQGGRMSLKRLGSLFNPTSARRTSLESSAANGGA